MSRRSAGWTFRRFLVDRLPRVLPGRHRKCRLDILADLDEPQSFPSIVDLPRFDAWAARMQGVKE